MRIFMATLTGLFVAGALAWAAHEVSARLRKHNRELREIKEGKISY